MKYRKKKAVWIITDGKYVDAPPQVDGTLNLDQAKAYKISQIARYMLCQGPVEVEERILGCTLNFRQPRANKFKAGIRRYLPQFCHAPFKDRLIPDEKILLSPFIRTPAFEDQDLERYFVDLGDLLRPYHPVFKKIDKVVRHKLADVSGICEDIGGDNHYKLNLKGSLDEKLEYVRENIGRTVKIMLKQAYLGDGLFEMRGFDFQHYDPAASHTMIRYLDKGIPKYVVLKDNGQVDFHVSDHIHIRFLQIFQQSLKKNHHLRQAFRQCFDGLAKPLRLFFSKQLEVSYSTIYLPALYKKLLDEQQVNDDYRKQVADMLNDNQRVVTFSYIPRSKTGNEKMFTHISVMHDMRALAPVKLKLPDFYSEIRKMASNSEAGTYYLLDSMKGSKNV